MANHETGADIMKAIITHMTKSLLSIARISATVAPFTFLIPISFVRDADAIIINPKRERLVIIIAMMLNNKKHLNS